MPVSSSNLAVPLAPCTGRATADAIIVRAFSHNVEAKRAD